MENALKLNIFTHVTNESGDYEALYVNGKLHTEQTTIPQHVFKEVAQKYQSFLIENLEVTADWIENEGGTYPATLEQIPKSALT